MSIIIGTPLDIENESCPGCGWIGAIVVADHQLQCRRCERDRGRLSEAQIRFLIGTTRAFGAPTEPVIIARAWKKSPMHRNQLFPSKYWKADDLPKPLDVTIEGSSLEKLNNPNGNVDEKLVIRFAGQAKKLVCNMTNYDAIADLHGEETEGWPGKAVQLYADTTKVGSKRVPCVRVRATSVSEQLNDKIGF